MRIPRLPEATAWTTIVLALSLALAGCGSNTSSTGCGSNCPPNIQGFLYAGSTGSIQTLTVDGITGALGNAVSTPGPQAPGGMVVDPASKFLYVSDLSNPTIDVFSITSGTGALTGAGSFTCRSGCGCSLSAISCPVLNLAMTPNGKFLYAIEASVYSTFCCFSTIAEWSVNSSTGGLTLIGYVTAGFNPVQMAIDPSGKFLYAPDQEDANGSIYSFNIDATSGALTPIAGSPFYTPSPGNPPIGVAVDPSGKYLYTALFFFVIQPYAIDPNTGALGPIASSPATGGGNLSFLAMDPLGKFLYAGSNGGILALTLDPNSGVASQVAGDPFNLGVFSWGNVLDPSGSFLYSADYTGSIRTFRVNRTTGALSPLGQPASAGQNPLFLALAK